MTRQGLLAGKGLAGLLKLALLISVIIAGNLLTSGIVDGIEMDVRPTNEPMLHQIIMISMAAYIVLMAIPFVPGVEIGLALMMILGPKIVPLVYGCTLISMCLAFLIGRLVPERGIIKFLREIHLVKAASFLESFSGLSAEQRLTRLSDLSPRRWIPWLLRHRYLTLMLAINLPGNMVLGGGGGLAMMAGMSKIFSVGRYLLLVAVAISPLPIILLIFGDRFANWPI
ncbi:hypothetical protein DXI23_10040 [Marinobacter flavimaris]|jgi:hypothetical protein|uniref:Uncharacterized protein n=2 Tax=Marinobacter TaxID=2742 RepID=A0A3D8H2B6_9GAMM|nr:MULTISPECIES: hypothetical protein [Marinobacter]PPI80435.1 hypothetical protein MDHKLMBL_08945 [Marinobacter flavimaris]RDU40874.1 hypothetical protein DXI23_10040 [Marinobacter flavimaris]HBC35715.1 hypothetical protein [Marinobacter adhaerens]|tara:strand:- start:68 stop:748 length:681 start_codon:yes stop_codon:yes gene_type:complete